MGRRRALILAAAFAVCFAAWGVFAFRAAPSAMAAEEKTGIGLSEHVLKAYDEGWKYQYGRYGQYVGGVRSTDCSGLIKSYLWWTGDDHDPKPNLIPVAGSSSSMLASAKEQGSIKLSDSSTLPRIHGLILYSPGHVGVYVGGNMSVDNRCSGQDVKYEKVIGGSYHWTKWFKLPQLSYPTTGLVTFNGEQYYYEGGQYVVNTTRTVDGVAYTFDASGVAKAAS